MEYKSEKFAQAITPIINRLPLSFLETMLEELDKEDNPMINGITEMSKHTMNEFSLSEEEYLDGKKMALHDLRIVVNKRIKELDR